MVHRGRTHVVASEIHRRRGEGEWLGRILIRALHGEELVSIGGLTARVPMVVIVGV